MGSFHCIACENELVSNEDMCLYKPVSSDSHLSIKFERAEQIVNEHDTIRISSSSKSSQANEYLIRSASIKCIKCGSTVGSRIHCGPNHDSLLCISTKATYNTLPDGSKMSNSAVGGASVRKKLLDDVLDQRNINQFYGTDMATMRSSVLTGTLKHPTIEDLDSLDDLSGLVKDKPRSYQLECFTAAALFPSIIQIPTGAGKTLISVMLASLYKRLNPGHMVWFLTDRVPLVFQQARYIEEQTSLTVLPLAGEIQTNLKPSYLVKYDVLVCTVQLLINMLVIGQVRIEDVSLIIFDEIHHAVRNHPYAVFIETFLSPKHGSDRPRLLGLTASPASGNPIQMKLKLKELSRLCSAQLYTPCLYRDDLQSAVNRPTTKFINVDLSRADLEFSDIIFKKIQSLLAQESETCSSLEEMRSIIRALSIKSRTDSNLAATVYRAHQLLTALEMTSILGCAYSRKFMSELLSKDRSLCEIEDRIIELCVSEGNVSPKAEALCNLLSSIDLVSAPETRMIVFVETKRTARWLASFLQERLTAGSWNPTAFTGQASNSIDGMSWDTEQRPILALFRTGHVKLLIATSVLQEGLDVAACNHIVLFDRTWSLKSFMQSRGRARARNSEYTIICSADDQSYYDKLFQQEEVLTKMVRDEMVDGQVLSLQLTMAVINLNVRFNKADFSQKPRSEFTEMDESLRTLLKFSENNGDEMDSDNIDSQFTMLLNVHNFEGEILEGPIDLNISAIERRSDHLPIFADQEEILIYLEIPSVILKRVRSWIPMSEELLDPLLNLKVPGGLIELDRLIPLTLGSDAAVMRSVGFELQKLAAGVFDSGNKFIEAASQHHSFTPSLSLVLFEPLSRRITILFQEHKREEKTFRIEIPFDSIDSFCLLTRSPEYLSEDSNFSLLVPVRTAPLLYVTGEDVCEIGIEDRLDEYNWEREHSASFSERFSGVFSLCPAVRLDLMLNGRTSQKLFQILSRIGSNILYTCNLEIESFPEYHTLWSMRLEKFLNRLDFETQYKLHTMLSETWSATSLRLDEEFLDLASECTRNLLEVFAKRIFRKRFINPLACLLACKAEIDQKACESPVDSLQDGMSVKLVTWTPSRLIHHSPTVFLSNRVLRQFSADNFIRVHFRDEDLSKLSIVKNNASIDKLLEDGVRSILEDGIVIGQRKFEFLAMSSSQLRNHGCWFVDVRLSAGTVRSWLGKFDEIKNVAKYVARLGQSFSASRPTLEISEFNFVPDWERNGYCFSDGCGMISTNLASELATRLDLSEIPSAFQIRYAGFKGVVAVCPTSEGLTLRPSMKKFESSNRSLDILNVAQAIPCFLNRQVIMILSALGVPNSSFEYLQLAHLKYLAESFNSFGKIFLKHCNLSNLDSSDPFMKSLITAQYRQQLSELLTKSRISVPKGRILMGVVDESGTLAENECFCQIRDEQLTQVIDASVVIAKNPCMHPGDVRVLKAVRSDLLENFSHNVIVFSRHGNRPVPNMCSGSDLDGDLYFVSWDQSLVPPQVDEPMMYEGLAATVKSTAITAEDLKSFMLFFIKNDQLGSIANTHVAFADQFSAGVRDPACVSLAKLFSLAVDFPKTGFVARIPKQVRVTKYPDFMQKPDKPSYSSHCVIGRLFREVKAVASEKIPETVVKNIALNDKFLVPGFEEYLVDSRRCYEGYCSDLGKCLVQYGFRMESHLLMNCTMSIELNIREMESDVLEVAQLTLDHIVRRYRNLFDCMTSVEDPSIAAKLASAWYHVTYSDPITPIGLDCPILSFPWIIKNSMLTETSDESQMSSPPSFNTLIAKDLRKWFIGGDNHQAQKCEINSMADFLSQSLILLNKIGSCLDDPELKFSVHEFLLTRSIVMTTTLDSKDISIRILKEFPSALIEVTKDKPESSIRVKLDFINIVLTTGPFKDYSLEFSSKESFILAYLLRKMGLNNLNISANLVKSSESCVPFEDSVKLEGIPDVLGLWLDWIGSDGIDETVWVRVVEELLSILEASLESSDEEGRISILRRYHSLIRTCRIDSLFCAPAMGVGDMSIDSCFVKNLLKNHPTIMRKIVNKSPMGPTGSSVYVQGAFKLLFRESLSDSDMLRCEVYDGPRNLSHLGKTCYRLSLRNEAQLSCSDPTLFAFNEFWAHAHRQLQYLSKFAGPEYGDFEVSLKLGVIYATDLPRMFIEQPVNIWLTRVAMEKYFRKSNIRRKQTGDEGKAQAVKSSPISIQIDLSRFKCNPRSHAGVDDDISSDKCAESLQSLLNSVTGGNDDETIEDFEGGKSSNNVTSGKKPKAFGKLSTAFDSNVSEEKALQLLKRFNFDSSQDSLKVSLTCYDEEANVNASLNLRYSLDGKLNRIRRRGLRWMVCDVSSDAFDSCRISISSATSVNEELLNEEVSIFSDGVVSLVDQEIDDSCHKFRVKESFRSNQSIFCRSEKIYSCALTENFTLNLCKITESFGVDPKTGLFALNREKWEIEGKLNRLDLEGIIESYRVRDRLIHSLWYISTQLTNL